MKRLAPNELPGWPYRMQAQLAAAYVGVSPSKFLEGVKDGTYPRPIRDGGNTLWLEPELKEAAGRHDGDGATSGGNPLDE